MYYDKAHAAVEFAGSQLGVKVPCDLELGVLGLKGTKLAVNTEDIRGPIQIGDVIVRRTLASAHQSGVARILRGAIRRDGIFATGWSLSFPARAASSIGLRASEPRNKTSNKASNDSQFCVRRLLHASALNF